MSQSLEFYYDYGSPAAYLAFHRLAQFQETYTLDVVHRPMLLGGVFKTIGNRAPVMIPSKGKYLFQDLLRYANRYGVTFQFNPHFPVNTLALMRAATALIDDAPALETLNRACFNAIWRDQKNMADLAVITEVLSETDLDLPTLFAATQNPEVKESLKQRTQEAVDRGIFGAPTFFYNGEMYWGQDRLFMIEEQLKST